MEQAVIVQENQLLTKADFENFGKFPREAIDHVVFDGIEPGMKFTGFPVAATGPSEVTVGAGRLWRAGKVYYRDDEGGVSIDLSGDLPSVTKKIIAIVAWGTEEDAEPQARTFLIDPRTRATQGDIVPTVSRRHANIDRVVGEMGPDPRKPAVDANVLVLAWVTVTTTGVESIERATDNVLVSARDNANALNELQGWRGQIGTRVDTLGTDIATLAAKLRGAASAFVLMQVAQDMASVKEMLDLPDSYTDYGADHFLTTDEVDLLHPDHLARIEEGIRFPAAQQRVAQINLLNQYDARVKASGNFILPNYVPRLMLDVSGNDGGELSISQYQHQTVNYVQRTVTRTRVRWGNTYTVCTNSAWWQSGDYDPISGTFRIGGETFKVEIGNPGVDSWVNPNNPNHRTMRLTQFWLDTIVDAVYWDRIVGQEGVNGSIIGQTFLVSQDQWLTQVDLYFTRVATTGDVTLLITNTNESGAPDIKSVVGSIVVPAANLKVFPAVTQVGIAPTFLEKGKRYGIVLVTPGNHFVATRGNAAFSQGTLFHSTDGAWFQGDLMRDLSFRLWSAQFDAPRVEVQLQPLELENGISNIDILNAQIAPEGTRIVYEVQINGVWTPVANFDGTHPLNGLPSLLQLRAVFLGTTDLMPGIGIGPASQVLTWRPRTDFKAVSTAQTMKAPVTRVEVEFRLEYWNAARHVFSADLLVGATFATVETADVVETNVAPDDPSALIRRYVFNLAAPVSSFKVRCSGTTDNALVTYHVAKRFHIGFAS